MALRGMDVEEVERLIGQLEFQANAINAVVGVVDVTVSTLTSVWFGADLQRFHGTWQGNQRAQAHAAAVDIADALAILRREIAEQRRTSGGGGGGSSRGAQAPAPPSTSQKQDYLFKKGGKKVLIEGEHRETHPAPGSVETTDVGHVEVSGSAEVGKDGLAFAGGVAATVAATSSKNEFPGPAGTTGELNVDQRIGADLNATAKLGPKGGSVGVQAMAGVEVGTDGAIGNDVGRVTGGLKAVGGLGAEFKGSATYDNGKLKIGLKGGAALGIGGKASAGIEIDVAGAQRAAEKAAKTVGSWFRWGR